MEKEQTTKLSTKFVVITVLYTIIIGIPSLYLLIGSLDSIEAFTTGDLFIILYILLVLAVVLLPYIFMIIGLKKKDSGLLKTTITYELVFLTIGVAFAAILWLAWPSIKSNINGCDWCNISTYEGGE